MPVCRGGFEVPVPGWRLHRRTCHGHGSPAYSVHCRSLCPAPALPAVSACPRPPQTSAQVSGTLRSSGAAARASGGLSWGWSPAPALWGLGALGLCPADGRRHAGRERWLEAAASEVHQTLEVLGHQACRQGTDTSGPGTRSPNRLSSSVFCGTQSRTNCVSRPFPK